MRTIQIFKFIHMNRTLSSSTLRRIVVVKFSDDLKDLGNLTFKNRVSFFLLNVGSISQTQFSLHGVHFGTLLKQIKAYCTIYSQQPKCVDTFRLMKLRETSVDLRLPRSGDSTNRLQTNKGVVCLRKVSSGSEFIG